MTTIPIGLASSAALSSHCAAVQAFVAMPVALMACVSWMMPLAAIPISEACVMNDWKGISICPTCSLMSPMALFSCTIRPVSVLASSAFTPPTL